MSTNIVGKETSVKGPATQVMGDENVIQITEGDQYAIETSRDFTRKERLAAARVLDKIGYCPGLNLAAGTIRAISSIVLYIIFSVGELIARCGKSSAEDRNAKIIREYTYLKKRCGDEFQRGVVELIPGLVWMLDEMREEKENSDKTISGGDCCEPTGMAYGKYTYSIDPSTDSEGLGYHYLFYSKNKAIKGERDKYNEQSPCGSSITLTKVMFEKPKFQEEYTPEIRESAWM